MISEAPQTDYVQADISAVLHNLEHDHEFLIQFFIPDQLVHPVPPIHTEVLQLMKNVDEKRARAAIAIPRGHAKTTLAKIVTIWYWLFTSFSFIIYVSSTLPNAKNACLDIIEMLQSENFQLLFGEVEWLKTDSNMGLYIFKIPLLNKVCVLRAIGAGQKMRGINLRHNRPQLAVLDDLEDYELIESAVQAASLSRWFYGTFMKALDIRRNAIIMIGNMLSNDCLLKAVCDNPEWFSRIYGAIKADGTPLWEDIWSLEELRADFMSYRREGKLHIWMAEMMNYPIPEGGGLIEAAEIPYHPQYNPSDLKYNFITVDPAISKKNYADNSAIVVHGFHRERNKWMPVDHYLGKLDPLELFQMTIYLARKWGVRVIGIEAIAYQASLQHFFPYLLRQQGDTRTEVVPLKAQGRKTERLLAWCSYMKDGQYELPEQDILITRQLLQYDANKDKNDDDLADACAYGPQMINEFMPLIMHQDITASFKQKPLLLGAKVETI